MLQDEPIIKSMGFALAVAVVLRRLRGPDGADPGADVPAGREGLVAAGAGSTGSCPNVDVEGEKLERPHLKARPVGDDVDEQELEPSSV